VSRPNRIVFLDALRGVAIILMVVNHTSRWWIERPMGWPRYWLVYGSMLVPATLFLFLVGFCLPMPFRGKALPALREAWPRYARRGLEIILWGYVLNLIVFRHEDPVWVGGVLHTIGLCVILTAPLMWLVDRTWRRVAIVAAAVLLYAAFIPMVPTLQAWTRAHKVAGQILFFDFPLWPWFAAPLIGLVAGATWLDARARGPEHERLYFAVIAGFGGLCLLWYAAWELLVPSTPRFGFARDVVLNAHWTPRGVSLALIGGTVSILLATTYWLGEVRGLRMRWLVVLGQTALVLYFVHQIVAHTVVKQALGIEFKSWTAYWLANIALMVGLLAFSQLWLVGSARIRAWRAAHAATGERPATTEVTR
jgi:uncharacterized membrane protein